METVHVFVWGDGIQHGIGVKVFGQRQLHEDAVHLRIGVEFGDFGKQRFLSGVGGQFVFEAGKTRFFGLDAFVAHIDFAGRVIADEDDGKAGLDAGFLAEKSGIARHFSADSGGKGFAVNDVCTHWVSLVFQLVNAARIASAVSRNSARSAAPLPCEPSVLPAHIGIRCIW